jgi:hypothetical protein
MKEMERKENELLERLRNTIKKEQDIYQNYEKMIRKNASPSPDRNARNPAARRETSIEKMVSPTKSDQ